MRYSETKFDEQVLQTLLRLSADWEAEQSCWGYRANTPEDLKGRRVFIAEKENEIVAYLFGLVEQASRASSIMPDGMSYFEIEELYVLPAYRSMGIGRKLFRFAENRLAAEGEVQFLMLSTATKNAKAILHFYLDELEMVFWSARLFKPLKSLTD